MSHLTCPKCASTEHSMGYGYAAGPLGAYTFCDGCEELIDFSPDTEGMNDEDAKKARENAETYLRATWGDKYESQFAASQPSKGE